MQDREEPGPDWTGKILIIRRDNIGDLVCTTPLLATLRAQYPHAHIYALVNSYNLPVLENNQAVDKIFFYTKAKHRRSGQGILSVYWGRLVLLARLWRERIDYVIFASPNAQARMKFSMRIVRPKYTIGFSCAQRAGKTEITMSIPDTPIRPMHEVENVFRLLAPLGIQGGPPRTGVVESRECRLRAQSALASHGLNRYDMLIGIHISARKPSQRWPAERFAGLIRKLHEYHKAAFVLLWSPGAADNALHPGDDEKAGMVMAHSEGLPIAAYPTHDLRDLIAVLSLCDVVICGDGGAMHIAAALDKKILCFFGDSDAVRWRPWAVPHVLLQPPTRDVADISVEEAEAGFRRLLSI